MEQRDGNAMVAEQAPLRLGISGSTLKLIAVTLMALDHVGAVVLERLLVAAGLTQLATTAEVTAFMARHGGLYWTDFALRLAGRVAFPLFCFLLVEGFLHTRSVRRYALRLGAFALLSEIPFDLANSGVVSGRTTWLEPSYQNVFFTLLVGLLTIWAMDALAKHTPWPRWGRALADLFLCAAGMGAALLLRCDYDFAGVLAIVLFYLLRRRRMAAAGAGCTALLAKGIMEASALLSLIPIRLYDGRRGLPLKYFFYLFYPVHLLALWLVCVGMGIA